MSAWILAAIVLTAALFGSGVVFAESGEPAEPTAPSSPQQEREAGMLLRLHDLPRGYHVFDGSPESSLGGVRCGAVEPADPLPKLARFISRYKPEGCLALYLRMYEVPGEGPAPFVVGTAAAELESAEAADAGLAASRLLISHATSDELPEEVKPPATVGEETRLFRWSHAQLFAEDEESTSWLVWRSGTAIAVIFVAGQVPAANDRIAVELAQRQQKRIEAAASYLPAELDDTEVGLENPAIEFPVYWLGRRFEPKRRLAPLRLVDTFSSPSKRGRFPDATLLYEDHPAADRSEAIYVNLYSLRHWKWQKAVGQELPDTLRCGKKRRLKLPGGRAVISNGFERWETRRRGCPHRMPTAYTARIHLPGAVVNLERIVACESCRETAAGDYASFEGMAAIARGLVLRP
ncbi:MAG TPA: hypothetical protein VGW80_09450 [Solirubrobacterales bacterium]|nr:hypothetical protein [Solirubrobacterales bacterium]